MTGHILSKPRNTDSDAIGTKHHKTRNTHSVKKAVIYARCASAQMHEVETILKPQIKCSEDYATRKGYKIVQVFAEPIPTQAHDYPVMDDMLAFLRQHGQANPHVVLMDEMIRLPRDISASLQVRGAIAEAGGILEFTAAHI